LQGISKERDIFKKSFKYLLTRKFFNCSIRLMNDQLRPCRNGMGSAGVPPAVFGVPPNTSSPGFKRAGMIQTAIAASSSKAAGPNCAQSNLKSPAKIT
jgi:hypothetical protein